MLTRRTAAAVALLFGAGLGTTATEAHATDGWGSTTCSVATAHCHEQVGTYGSVGRASGSTGQGGAPKPVGGHGAQGSAKPTCVQVPDSGMVTLQDGSKGYWYHLDCGQGFLQGQLNGPALPRWASARPNGKATAPTVSPAQLAQQAGADLVLPKPQLRLNPGGLTVVQVPVWLWLDRTAWAPHSSTASVPGLSVTATAAPESVSWDLGDGTSVVCHGAGTPFSSSADPASASPDCGHVYVRSGQYTVTATVHWRVAWSGAGQGGSFPDLTTTGGTQLRVAQVAALVSTPPGR